MMARTRTSSTKSQLIKKADKYFSLAIRYRDGKEQSDGWYTLCITCEQWKPLKTMHAGHFMSRRYQATRYDDENVNGQCPGCNTFRYGEQYKYSKALELKYGTGTAERLAQKAHQITKLTTHELEEIINEAKEVIRFYERN